MKILLVKYRNIGDVLLSTALIENLKIHYPNAQIDFALNDYCESMVKYNPNVDNVYSYKRSYYKSLTLFKRVVEEFKYFKNIISNGYDIIINLTEGERGAYISLLSFNAKIKLGYELENSFLKKLKPYNMVLNRQAIHTVSNDLNFLELLNKKIQSNKVSIYWNDDDKYVVDQFLKNNDINTNFIQIHPVSRWMFKCWDDKRFAEIIDYVKNNKGFDVVITASPDKIEKDKVDNILNYCQSKSLNLSGKLTLNQLAYLSSISKLFLGIDSAPMHIAAAVDTPVISLFGASYPHIWAPWNNYEENTYEYKDGVQKVGVHTIYSSTNKNIYIKDGIKVSEGMMNITLNDIKGIIDEYF